MLSLDTGFMRDYSEGAAYREYFATDALMFDVSRTDVRLRNKAEVLVLRLPRPSSQAQPVAISADFLRQRPVYHVDGADPPLVVITSRAGANRVYRSGSWRFVSVDDEGRVLDRDRRGGSSRKTPFGRRSSRACDCPECPRTGRSGSGGMRSIQTHC